jgi:hypothetical protein
MQQGNHLDALKEFTCVPFAGELAIRFRIAKLLRARKMDTD